MQQFLNCVIVVYAILMKHLYCELCLRRRFTQLDVKVFVALIYEENKVFCISMLFAIEKKSKLCLKSRNKNYNKYLEEK